MNDNVRFFLIKKIILISLFGGAIYALLFFSLFSDYCSERNQASALTTSPTIEIVSIPAPANLTAIVISSSRIDLAWESVSEAVYYNIYRNGSFTASTSQLSYSDTGLSPATDYDYYVTAVDGYGAESPQSNVVSVTTLAEVVPFAEQKQPATVIPYNLFLTINNNDEYVNSLDVILLISAQEAFQMAISNKPDFSGAVWEKYQISKVWRLSEGEGQKEVFIKFRSLSGGISETISDFIIFDRSAPLNVSNLEAIAGDKKIFLKWKNPSDNDFGGVKITGSTEFYPSSPEEGIPLYQGGEEYFLAIGLTNGVRYYYTVFSYDQAGNLSSGAVISAVPFEGEFPPPPLPPLPPTTTIPEIEKLTIEDFNFEQAGEIIFSGEEAIVQVRAEEPLTISLDYEKVPEVLKTIMVTLEKEGKSFSFLLRIDSQKTKYQAVLLVPQEAGVYNLTFDILDYKNQALKKISGYLKVEKEPEPFLPSSVSPSRYGNLKIWFSLIPLIILIFAIIFLAWKRRKRSDEKY